MGFKSVKKATRAWMLEGITSSLPAGDARCNAFVTLAGKFRRDGLESIHSEYYEGGWAVSPFIWRPGSSVKTQDIAAGRSTTS